MPGLYFVVVGTELLYVGKSGNLWDRWYQYPLHAVFEGAGPYAIAYHTILDPEALALAERETIRALRPPLNFHYIPGALEHQRKHRPRFYGPRKTPPPA
jgi:excinuclease UvrABC nuclease subunit